MTNDPLEEVPDWLKDRLTDYLDVYAERARQVRLNAALGLNPAVGGGRRYLDEYRAKAVGSVRAERAQVRKFLQQAAFNGVDGKAVVRALARDAFPEREGDPLGKLRLTKTRIEASQREVVDRHLWRSLASSCQTVGEDTRE